MSNQKQRTIFITGSSSGLGRATAKLFASRGWKVIASMRNPNNEKELGSIPGMSLISLDIKCNSRPPHGAPGDRFYMHCRERQPPQSAAV